MGRTQVIIVGGGPVGVALAVALGLAGIRCTLVERRIGLANIPKGQNLTQRTLEHFHFWGIARELRATRLMPPGYPIGGVTAYKSLSSPYWHAPAGREMVRDYFFEANERLPQYCMEAVLRARMSQLATVEARFGWTAGEVQQDADGVRVTLQQEGGGREVLEADYLVGCDGSQSRVRGELGIPRSGTDFDQLMVLAVFRSKELHEGLKRFPPRSTYRVLDPALKGYWQFFGRIDVGEGWFFHSPVPADTTKDSFDFHGLLQDVAGFPFACTFDHVGFWDLKVAVADSYQVGRVFIAGDAAHTHPPYGGFGLNNGLEDAVNLGWKLVARLQGWGGDTLLSSYGTERRPVFFETAEDFIAQRIAYEADILERFSPERDPGAFEAAWKELEGDGGNRVTSYEPNYAGSPLVTGPPGARSSAHGTHMFKARPGHHLGPQPLSNGRNVYEELGRGFTLLALDAAPGAVAAFETAAGALGIPLKVIADSRSGGRERYEAALVLVRPDQHATWAGDHAPADVAALLAKAVGRAVA